MQSRKGFVYIMIPKFERPYQCRFSENTRVYLEDFHRILDEMIQGMRDAGLADSISYNFIVQMIPHHRAAIRMSENLLKYTTYIPLEKIARQIVSEQTKSIGDMQRIKEECRRCANPGQALCGYQNKMERIMAEMFRAMEDAQPDNDINVSFMREMIPHHMGAVEMSEWTLEQCVCPELVPILQAIITSQERGICQMTKLLREIERCNCVDG